MNLGKHFARVDGSTNKTETTKYFYQTDHLGSTVMVMDKEWEAGLFRGVYALWDGKLRGRGNEERSEVYKEESGSRNMLYNFNTRQYDPDTGGL